MLPFKKILFPVDYSDSCRALAPYVKEWKQHFSAELVLIHAYALQPAFAARTAEGSLVYDEVIAVDPAWPSEIQAAEQERLRKFAASAFAAESLETVLEEGEPGTVIHRYLQREGADLVVLPTRGLGPIRRLLLGSVTAKVLHDVAVPVLTEAGAAIVEHQPQSRCRTILCALEPGEEAEAVLKAGCVLAKSFGAELHLVRVVPTPPPGSEIDFTPYRKELIDAADVWLRELKGKFGIDVPHAILDAEITEGIRHEAIRRKADLIVTGRGHAQDFLSRAWSHLYPIVRESPCPVLSI